MMLMLGRQAGKLLLVSEILSKYLSYACMLKVDANNVGIGVVGSSAFTPRNSLLIASNGVRGHSTYVNSTCA